MNTLNEILDVVKKRHLANTALIVYCEQIVQENQNVETIESVDSIINDVYRQYSNEENCKKIFYTLKPICQFAEDNIFHTDNFINQTLYPLVDNDLIKSQLNHLRTLVSLSLESYRKDLQVIANGILDFQKEFVPMSAAIVGYFKDGGRDLSIFEDKINSYQKSLIDTAERSLKYRKNHLNLGILVLRTISLMSV